MLIGIAFCLEMLALCFAFEGLWWIFSDGISTETDLTLAIVSITIVARVIAAVAKSNEKKSKVSNG